MPPQQQNQYDFILDPSQQKRGGPAFLQNPKQKKLALVAFTLTVVLVLMIGANLLFSAGKGSNEDLVDLIAYQAEIARVSELGLDTSTDLNTRNQVATLQAFMKSDLSETVSYLGKNGETVSKEQRAVRHDSTIDTALDTAIQTNSFDAELIEQIDALMVNYTKILRDSLTSPEGPNKKILLETAASNVTAYYNN